MSEDLSSLINNVKNMVDSGNVPDNIKELLNNINSNTSSDNPNRENVNNSSDFDINTILKIKSIIDNLNNKDDQRSKLLYSLKPYLRESRKNKLDQYVNLLNIAKIMDIMNNEKKENNGNV